MCTYQNQLPVKYFVRYYYKYNNYTVTKIEIFDIGHSNDECQNDLYVKTYDVGHQNGHLNVEHQHVMNVKILSLQRLTLKYGTSKWFECQHHLNVEYQNDLL